MIKEDEMEAWDAIRAEAGWRACHSSVVPDDHIHIVSYLLGIGYPADRPLKPIVKPNRRPFAEVVHRGQW